MDLILALALFHFLANFAFQSETMLLQKKTNKIYLIVGSIIWTLTIWLILNQVYRASYYDLAQLFTGHSLISYWRVSRKTKRHVNKLYLIFEWVVNAGQVYLAYKF